MIQGYSNIMIELWEKNMIFTLLTIKNRNRETDMKSSSKKVRFSFVPKIGQSSYLYSAKIPKLAKLHAVLNAVVRDMV